MKQILKFSSVALLGVLFMFQSCTKDEVQTSEVELTMISSSGPLSWAYDCAPGGLTLPLVGIGNKQIQQSPNGADGWVQIAQVSSGDDPLAVTISVDPGTYYFRYRVGTGGGFTAVTVVVDPFCTDSFSYSVDGDVITFTYVSEDDIADAALVMTFAQGTTIEGPDGWDQLGQTMQTTLNVDACTTYTWVFTVECGGGPGSNNRWTYFKVNDVSMKGDLGNISCN